MIRKSGTALVVGAGISGIRAALDLAEVGYGVTLIDRAPHIGGILSQLDYQFPTDRCGMCKLLPLIERDAGSQFCLRRGLFHDNMDILLSTEIASVEGEPGNFKVRLKQKPVLVNPELCIGCGECTAVCPVETPDDFNAGLGKRKAIYLPVPHAIPNSYVIDTSVCTRCRACEDVCPTKAISLTSPGRKKFRVLVVDDELIVRDSLKEWLENEEFIADMAGSGAEALEKLTGQSYRLMLLDIKMPGMDGVEVLKKAKEIFPDIIVVMMTAYATVETAVEAMKIGALDYLMKPFDPDAMMSKILKIYEDEEAKQGRVLTVGSVVLCGGSGYYDPASGKNTMGYGVYPNVLTSLEFERILSGVGPCQGKIVRHTDGKPIRKAAWIQCIGSRDLQADADFCSSICCMISIKECLLLKEKTNQEAETVIFYIDMRTYEKPFQRYRDAAETEFGVRFERARIHSIVQNDQTHDLTLHYLDHTGQIRDETFDLVVLAVGQRPTAGAAELAQLFGISLNRWGFVQVDPFYPVRTEKKGIVIGGAFSGLKDISESVIQASAAALEASRILHASGGSLLIQKPEIESADVSREIPSISAVICTCGSAVNQDEQVAIENKLKSDGCVKTVFFLDQMCTAQGWEKLMKQAKQRSHNRLLVGACLPCVYSKKLKDLAHQSGLHPALFDAVDIRNLLPDARLSTLFMSIAKLKYSDPLPVSMIPVLKKALVVGGGISGMTAALAVADHGFETHLVEKTDRLGGNLLWLKRTLDGLETKGLLEDTVQKVEKHPLIRIHMNSRVIASFGQSGNFHTTLESSDGEVVTIEHGAAVIAAGGTEAPVSSYGYGTHPGILTQKQFDEKLDGNQIDFDLLTTVVMIQCAGTREEPKNYCSRVCCVSALKQALTIKSKRPETAIYILYRDMMTYGFTESYFTQARKAGVIFIQYDTGSKPTVRTEPDKIFVTAVDPIIQRKIEIEASLLILAAGIVPQPMPEAAAFGAEIDADGFFKEAESKWRPVESLKEGVSACGLALSPRSIAESILTAQAAAQKAIKLLTRQQIPVGKVTAKVRQNLCSFCYRCIAACPYHARYADEEMDLVQVDPLLCQGCGACASICPNGASVVEGFLKQQMFEVIDAAFA